MNTLVKANATIIVRKTRHLRIIVHKAGKREIKQCKKGRPLNSLDAGRIGIKCNRIHLFFVQLLEARSS